MKTSSSDCIGEGEKNQEGRGDNEELGGINEKMMRYKKTRGRIGRGTFGRKAEMGR